MLVLEIAAHALSFWASGDERGSVREQQDFSGELKKVLAPVWYKVKKENSSFPIKRGRI